MEGHSAPPSSPSLVLPWVKQLLRFAENFALNPNNLSDSKCPVKWLPNRRVGIDSSLQSCVRVLDDNIETVPRWAVEEMKYFEKKELPPVQLSSNTSKSNEPINLKMKNRQEKPPQQKHSIHVNNKASDCHTNTKRLLAGTSPTQNNNAKRRRITRDGNNNSLAATASTRLGGETSTNQRIRQQLNHPTIIPPAIPSTGDIYLKSQWSKQWSLRSMALHFPSAKVKRSGEQILYLCQSCPRIHDNLALRLAR